jgi:hypothetical protein
MGAEFTAISCVGGLKDHFELGVYSEIASITTIIGTAYYVQSTSGLI